jgi:hypothetical protein
MKNYAKVGNKSGSPAYRSPSTFKIRQCQKNDRYRLKKDSLKIRRNDNGKR